MPGPFTPTQSADGVRTVFTSPVLVSGDVLFFVDRIPQYSGSDFTYVVGVSLTTFTFTSAPPTGASLAFLTGAVLQAPGSGTATSTLATVRTTIRQRADMVNSQFVTDAELNGWINASYFELFDLLVAAYGDDYFVGQPTDPYVLTTDGLAEVYPLPNGTSTYMTPLGAIAAAFYKLLAVDLQIGGDWQPLHRFSLGDRHQGQNKLAYGRTVLRYRLQGNFIWFSPMPSASQKVRLIYVPRLLPLVADGDVIDGVSGWEEYIVVDCVLKAKTKEESDVSVEIQQRNALKMRIEGISVNRDAGEPITVSDVRSDDCSESWV